jgi:hypothetical protein
LNPTSPLPVPSDRSLPLLRSFVFIIGFNKTATTALAHLFQANGVPTVHYDNGRLALAMIENAVKGRKVFAGYDQRFKVFSDFSFFSDRLFFEGNQMFRAMDRDYPGAFFVYNVRPMEKWIASRCRHFSGRGLLDRAMNAHNTQNPEKVKAIWRREREAFETEVREHFGASKRLLWLDVEAEDVVARISAFVGLPLDPASWIKLNVTPP